MIAKNQESKSDNTSIDLQNARGEYYRDNTEQIKPGPEPAARRRGRPKAEPKWSRIIDIDAGGHFDLEGHEIEKDMKDLEDNPLPAQRPTFVSWAPAFEPSAYWQQSTLHALDENVISKRNLKFMAKAVSQKR